MTYIDESQQEIKSPRPTKRWRRRPNPYTNDWADTREIRFRTSDLSMACCYGSTCAQVIIRLAIYMWQTQKLLPDEMPDDSQTIRAIGVERKRLRQHYAIARQEAHRMVAYRRAPLCDGAREEIFAKCNGRCRHCDITLNFQNFHVDHLVPIAQGGLSHNDNLVASCQSCNLTRPGGRG